MDPAKLDEPARPNAALEMEMDRGRANSQRLGELAQAEPICADALDISPVVRSPIENRLIGFFQTVADLLAENPRDRRRPEGRPSCDGSALPTQRVLRRAELGPCGLAVQGLAETNESLELIIRDNASPLASAQPAKHAHASVVEISIDRAGG